MKHGEWAERHEAVVAVLEVTIVDKGLAAPHGAIAAARLSIRAFAKSHLPGNDMHGDPRITMLPRPMTARESR
jgi:hypothetical protein